MTEDRDTLAARLLAEHDKAAAALAVLSPRQRECMLMAARGLTGEAAAKRLGIAENTAGNHRAAGMAKLGMTMPQAIALMAKAGWL